jgi:hypothetical protein
MTTRIASWLMAAGVATWVVACNHATTPSPIPGSGSPPASAVAVALSVTVPPTVAPDETAALKATASLSDGTKQDYTQKVLWRSSDSRVLTITFDGRATGHALGEVTVSASLARIPTSNTKVLVLPPNTYRLTGAVLESNLPVLGATVSVTAGVSTGLSTKTLGDGTYRLYGIAGPSEITVHKDGYVDLVKTTMVTRSDVLDFPEARQDTLLSLSGRFTLTLTADPACSNQAAGGLAPLAPEYRTRTYTADVTQNGPTIDVRLSGANFWVQQGRGDHFSGRIEPGRVTFALGDSYYYYYYFAGGQVIERLPDGSLVGFNGFVDATQSASGLSGSLNGYVGVAQLTGNSGFKVLASCRSEHHQFALTPQGAPARRR